MSCVLICTVSCTVSSTSVLLLGDGGSGRQQVAQAGWLAAGLPDRRRTSTLFHALSISYEAYSIH